MLSVKSDETLTSKRHNVYLTFVIYICLSTLLGLIYNVVIDILNLILKFILIMIG